jgi:enoyl-CoA hydratase
LLLTSERIDAEQAWRIGLVNRVVEPQALLATARALLAVILTNAPVAVGLTMDAVDVGISCGQEEGLRFESSAFGLAAATEDRLEGAKAFLEKRPAEFTGR